MELPPPDTPLYNHPLPQIEEWLRAKGCRQDNYNPSIWYVDTPQWSAELIMDVEDIRVRYASGDRDIWRAFPYSLSRQDIEDAIFSGP
ncbi:MAG: DUF3143 domain-containing protein [Pseudanabaenaceae cyanobacterium]